MRKFLLFALLAPALSGCMKPYDRPEYVEIDTSESAFLIPLEGDTTNQAAFSSVQFLEQKKVAAKRIQITHRWNATGYWPTSGEWIGEVRLVKAWDRKAAVGLMLPHPAFGAPCRAVVIPVTSEVAVLVGALGLVLL